MASPFMKRGNSLRVGQVLQHLSTMAAYSSVKVRNTVVCCVRYVLFVATLMPAGGLGATASFKCGRLIGH